MESWWSVRKEAKASGTFAFDQLQTEGAHIPPVGVVLLRSSVKEILLQIAVNLKCVECGDLAFDKEEAVKSLFQ